MSSYHDAQTSMPPKGLRVLILGPLRHLLKISEAEIPFPADGSHHAFWESMLVHFPEIGTNQRATRLARNSRFLLPDEMISPGDEIALIPPVSGG